MRILKTVLAGVLLCGAVGFDAQSLSLNDSVGICTHFGHGWEPEPLMSKAKDLGVGWIRDGIYWPEVEPQKGVYRIPPMTQRWVDEAHKQGLKVLFSFSKSNPNYDDFDADAYARAAAFVATALRGKVDAIEVLNEPNNASAGFRKRYGGEWAGIEKDGSTSPWLLKYVELLNKTAEAVKKANPQMKVVGLGAASSANLRALSELLPAVDGVTDHPYSSRSIPEISGKMEHDAGTGHENGDPGSFQYLVHAYRTRIQEAKTQKEIWFTEWGFSTFHDEGRPNPGHFSPFTLEEQGVYIQRRLLESLALGVDRSFIYDSRNDGSRPNEVEDNFGLLQEDLSLKPAFNMVQRVVGLTAHWKSLPSRSIRIESAGSFTVRAYLFQPLGGGTELVYWKVSALSEGEPLLATIKVQGCKPSGKLVANNLAHVGHTPLRSQVQAGALVLRSAPLLPEPQHVHLNCTVR
jgi:hypothetical protein